MKVDVPEVRRQVRQPVLHVQAFVVPAPQPRDYEGVAKGMQHWVLTSVTRPYAGPGDNGLKAPPQGPVRHKWATRTSRRWPAELPPTKPPACPWIRPLLRNSAACNCRPLAERVAKPMPPSLLANNASPLFVDVQPARDYAA